MWGKEIGKDRKGMDRMYRVGAESEKTGRNKYHMVYGNDYDDESRKCDDIT